MSRILFPLLLIPPAIMVLLLSSSGLLSAATLPGDGKTMRLTMEEADRLARAHAPGISVASSRIQMAAARADGVRSLLYPSVTLSVSSARGERPEGWYGRDSLKESSAGISVEQNLLVFGRYTAAKNEQAGMLGAAKVRLKVHERDVARQARIAFIDLLVAHAMTSLHLEAATHRLRMWEQSKALFQAGTIDRLAVFAAESESISAHEAAERSRLAIIRAENILRISIGQAKGSLQPVGAVTRSHDSVALLARARARLHKGVEFENLAAEKIRLSGRLDGLRAEARPRLAFSSNVAYRDDRVVGDRGTDWDCRLALEWQITDGGRRDSMERETRLELESVASQTDDLASERRSMLSELESRVGLVTRRLPEQEKANTLLRRNLDAATALYQSGQAPFESVRNAASRYDEGRLALLELLAEEKSAVEELKAFVE